MISAVAWQLDSIGTAFIRYRPDSAPATCDQCPGTNVADALVRWYLPRLRIVASILALQNHKRSHGT